MKLPNFSLILLSLCLFTGCAPKELEHTPAPASTYFPINIGTEATQLQLALNSTEHSLGLMHRDSMDKDHGMLFLFEKPGPRSFWMRNTRIPLDIGYFDASGTLLEIHSLYPYDETPVKSYSQYVLIAVEMNHGWFASHNIKPSAKIDMSHLEKALKKRGKNIHSYLTQPIQ
ncbi:MAG: DUF192 domain-containing protein [Opitutaceae bacterium]